MSLLACLLAATDISLFGQEERPRLNGSREMWYLCQDELELIKGQFVNVCVGVGVGAMRMFSVHVCVQGIGFQDNVPDGTLAWSPEDMP